VKCLKPHGPNQSDECDRDLCAIE